jgi:leucyl-tRNA synthetase
MDIISIEKKWQKKWNESKVFEPKVEKEKKKFFVTAAYPYVQAPQHIGHARTYSTADTYSRFKRMKGFNVLFPMAWHITGTPILAIARRIQEGAPDLKKDYMEMFDVTSKDFDSFKEPKNIVKYFSAEIKDGMKKMGFSIDWTREFTTGDLTYNRFIEWQFKKLNEFGFIKKGSHPVLYCPKCQNPVGEHETLHDKRGEIEEAVAIKFEMDGKYLPAGTFRPETIYGVTNFWVNPEGDYVEAEVGGETWIISEKFSEKLKFQKDDVKVNKKLKGVELVGKYVVAPIVNRKVMILPASFVDVDNLTGLVSCVPAHAPYDWIGLKVLQEDEEMLKKYNLDVEYVKGLKPISLISVEGYGDFPGVEASDKRNIKSLEEKDKLEDATKEVYLIENAKGKMRGNTEEFKGMSVKQAKEKVKEVMIENNNAESLYYLANKPIFCRDGTECVVKTIRDQWFIDYGNKDLKDKAHKYIDDMKLLPPKTKVDYNHTIDWLHERACARRAGFGTKLPFDTRWIIEPLSDSTIYMAYYTIAPYIKGLEDKLDEYVFDYIFHNKGDIDDVSRRSSIVKELLETMKQEFEYWYPVDSRHSGKDLVFNHLTFYIMNHLAIFPENHWPQQIVANGFVMYEGQKMSKSLRNIVPIRRGTKKYGADIIRTAVLATAGLEQDSDFTENLVKTLTNKASFLLELTKHAGDTDEPIVEWLDSKLNRYADSVTNSMEEVEFRNAINDVLFLMFRDLNWYLKRSESKKIPKDFIEKIIKMSSPFMPHIAEEAWEKLGNKPFVSLVEWPEYDSKKVDLKIEAGEDLIKNIMIDIEEIKRLSKIEEPSKITLFVTPKWKYVVYSAMLDEKELKEVMKDEEMKKVGKAVSDYYKRLQKKKPLEDTFMTHGKEMKKLKEAKEFFEKEFEAEFEMLEAEKVKHPKALVAEPLKPGILVE